jgi:AcrR family transcriptional regulator
MKKVRTRKQLIDKPRRTPRQTRSQGTVDAVLFAASHILRSEGEDAVTTERIARAAGVSIGSLYQYFANKQAILAALRARHGAWLAAETRAGIELATVQPTLREAVRASIERVVAAHRPECRPREMAPFAPLSPEQFSEFRKGTEAYLRRHNDRIRPLDVQLAAAVITRAVEAVVFGMSRDEPRWLEHPAFVDEVTELVAGYLARRPE